MLSVREGHRVDDALDVLRDGLGSRTVSQTEMSVRPDGGHGLIIGNTDAGTSAESNPFRLALDLKPVEHLVDSTDEAIKLLESVAGGGRNTKALFANSDSRVVDRLHVDAVVGEKRVRSSLRKSGVADQNRNNVGRARPEKKHQ